MQRLIIAKIFSLLVEDMKQEKILLLNCGYLHQKKYVNTQCRGFFNNVSMALGIDIETLNVKICYITSNICIYSCDRMYDTPNIYIHIYVHDLFPNYKSSLRTLT